MALDQSALIEVLDALKTAEVDERVRQAAQTIYQALVDAELTAVIGAAPHQRTPERSAQRNGHRPRVLATTAGDLELRNPKLRAGSCFPSLLERRRRTSGRDPSQERAGPLGGEVASGAAWNQVHQQPVQPVDGLGTGGDQVLAALGQQVQHRRLVLDAHLLQGGNTADGNRHRDRVVRVAPAAVADR